MFVNSIPKSYGCEALLRRRSDAGSIRRCPPDEIQPFLRVGF
jgi:hypothetical protein